MWSHVGTEPSDWLWAVADDWDLVAAVAETVGLDTSSTGDRAVDEIIGEPGDDDAIIAILGLEKCPKGGYWRPLPGLCALAEWEADPGDDPESLLDAVPEEDGFAPDECFGYLAVYSGTPAGEDPDTGWPLFRPQELLRVVANPWSGGGGRDILARS